MEILLVIVADVICSGSGPLSAGNRRPATGNSAVTDAWASGEVQTTGTLTVTDLMCPSAWNRCLSTVPFGLLPHMAVKHRGSVVTASQTRMIHRPVTNAFRWMRLTASRGVYGPNSDATRASVLQALREQRPGVVGPIQTLPLITVNPRCCVLLFT
ncbi:hypothetical protein HD806DRAFT_381368 [Xylariaceae sp. AK1471]|nr:hypothetical protein HD806DRAFT_381368 [Xylariaceae sp. AK1471]